MLSIINERHITPFQEEMIALSESVPEKFDYEFEFDLNKSSSKKEIIYTTYTMEEVQKLLEASKKPLHNQEPIKRTKYPMMPRELVEKLVKEYFQYKEKENCKHKDENWDSTKTTELVTKTNITMKPSTCTENLELSATPTKKS